MVRRNARPADVGRFILENTDRQRPFGWRRHRHDLSELRRQEMCMPIWRFELLLWMCPTACNAARVGNLILIPIQSGGVATDSERFEQKRANP
jgi:hypothetical protein